MLACDPAPADVEAVTKPTAKSDAVTLQTTGTTTRAAVLARLREVAVLLEDPATDRVALQWVPGAASLSADLRRNPALPTIYLIEPLDNAGDYGDVVAYTNLFTDSGYRVAVGDRTSFRPTGEYVLVHRDGRLSTVPVAAARFKTPKGKRAGNPIFPGCPGYDPNLPKMPWAR